MTQIMFETFNVPFLYMANKSTLALFASERKTGVVLDCGAGNCSSLPIYEGYGIPHALQQVDIG
eukprot:Awhi_evm1s11809